MAVVYDDDVAPAGGPVTPPAAKGKLVYDEAPAAPAPAPAAAPSESLLDKALRLNPMSPANVRASPIYGALDTAGSGLLSLGGKAVAGYHGLADLVTGKGSDAAANDVNADRAALTAVPNSAGAQAIGKAGSLIEAPFHAVAAPLDRAIDNAGPLVRTAVPAVSEGIQDVASVLPFGAAGRAAKAADAAATVEGAAKPVVSAPLETARGVGYKAPPSTVARSNPALVGQVPGTAQESVIGPSGVRDATNLQNQVLTTKLAGQDIGLPNATKITAQDAANFRKNGPGPTYDATAVKLGYMPPDAAAADELGALVSDPNPATALQPKVRQKVDQVANKISSGSYTGTDWLNDVSWLRENGARSAAGTLEDMAERHLAGDPTGLSDYRNARMDFAKSYDIQNAIGRGGQIDAQVLRGIDDKYPNLLSGNTKLIATAARELPDVTTIPGSESGGGIHSRWQVMHNAIGGVVKNLPGMNPMTEGFQTQNFGRAQTPTEASYNQSFGRKPEPSAPALQEQLPPFPAQQGPESWTTSPGAGGPRSAPGTGIPLSEVLSTGVEKPAPLGLSLAPMGAPPQQGIPFRADAAHMAGGLELAPDQGRAPLGQSLSDFAGVKSQGVPEGIATRAPVPHYVQKGDTLELENSPQLELTPPEGQAYEAGQSDLPLGRALAPSKKAAKRKKPDSGE